MLLAVTDYVFAALIVLAYVIGAILAVAVAVGVPYIVGKLVYDRARTDDLANPAALGFGAAFFTVLLGLFVAGIALVWMS